MNDCVECMGNCGQKLSIKEAMELAKAGQVPGKPVAAEIIRESRDNDED